MAKRILTFNGTDTLAGQLGAAHYLEADYQPIAVRIHAETAPQADAEFNILADGTSILNDRASYVQTADGSGVFKGRAASRSVVLPKGGTSEADAEDFIGNPLSQGTWVTCEIVHNGGGKNFTVQVELETLAEEDEEPE